MSLGMPGFIMMVMIVVQNIVIFNVFAKYGTDEDITFFTAVNRFYILLNTPLWGLMRALQPVAGMNYGAGKYKRTISSLSLIFHSYRIVYSYSVLDFYHVLPADVLSVMFPSVKLTAVQLYRLQNLYECSSGIAVYFMALVWFPSIENAKPATQIGLLRQVVFLYPGFTYCSRFFGVRSIYVACAGIDWLVFL